MGNRKYEEKKEMKKYKLSKQMLEFYSVWDLKQYLNKPRKMPLKAFKIKAINQRITEIEKGNDLFFQQIQSSSLFRLASILMVSHTDLSKVLVVSYEEAKKRESKLGNKHLTKIVYNRRNKIMKDYLKNMTRRPYTKIDKNYVVNDPIIFDLMLAVVNEAHSKDLHGLINGKGNE